MEKFIKKDSAQPTLFWENIKNIIWEALDTSGGISSCKPIQQLK